MLDVCILLRNLKIVKSLCLIGSLQFLQDHEVTLGQASVKIVELLEKCSVKLGHELVEVVAGRKALVDGGLYFKPGLLDELKRLENVLPDLELIEIRHFFLFFIVVLLATRAHS